MPIAQEQVDWTATVMLPPEAGGEKEAGLAEAVHEVPTGVNMRIQL